MAIYSRGYQEGSFKGFCWEMDRGRFDVPGFQQALNISLRNIPATEHEEFSKGFEVGWIVGEDNAYNIQLHASISCII